MDSEEYASIIRELIANNELPRFVFKFISLDKLILLLKGGSIKFSKPSNFNDPFDCNITIDTNNTTEEIEKYVNDVAIRKNLNQQDKEQFLSKLLDPDERFKITNNAVRQSIDSHGLSCFSKFNTNLLMWAHYADSYNGACIKFDILKDIEFFDLPFLVRYEPQYPVINYLKNEDELSKLIVETKSKDWEYEQEMRVLKRNPGFYSFNKDMIIEIEFGFRVDENKRNRIIKLAKSKGYDNVKFYRTEIKKNEFGVTFIEL